VRTLVIGPTAAAELRAHRKEQAESRLKLGPEYNSLDLVFATELGSPYLLRNVVRAFKAALEDAKLPKAFRVYDLRHTTASLLIAAGEPVTAVSERLGHGSPAVTLAVYSHALPGQQARAAEVIERALAEKPAR
jgi:integrase